MDGWSFWAGFSVAAFGFGLLPLGWDLTTAWRRARRKHRPDKCPICKLERGMREAAAARIKARADGNGRRMI